MTVKVEKLQSQAYRKRAKRKIRTFERENPKFIRDPIHDLIKIDSDIVLEVLDTEPMQRLKNIRQLGLASFVYPGADHSRFSHSLGAYHLAGNMLDQLEVDVEYDRLVVQLAALLHDTGHGPFSHLFEKALKEFGYRHNTSHEQWTREIIQGHKEVCTALRKVRRRLPIDVSDVIANNYEPKYLSSIVSSQFDVDRLDYMLRDSVMTGVHYGKYDLNWIMRNLSTAVVQASDEDGEVSLETRIVIDGKRGLSCLENYLLGNYYLYKHLYYHRTIQAAEGMLAKILSRAICLASADSTMSSVLSIIGRDEEIRLEDYLSLDDHVVLAWIHGWAAGDTQDAILRDLSQRLLKRRLFKVFPLDPGEIGWTAYTKLIEAVKKLIEDNGLDPKYYQIISEPARIAYKNFFFLEKNNKLDQEIHFVDSNGEICKYTQVSVEDRYKISKAILGLRSQEHMLIVADEIKDEVGQLVQEATQ